MNPDELDPDITQSPSDDLIDRMKNDCSMCKWRVSWLRRPDYFWCAKLPGTPSRGVRLANGEIAPPWCPGMDPEE